MKLATFNIPIDTYASAGLPDWAHYLLIFTLFSTIICGVVGIMIFAKWLTWGPKFKTRWHKMTGKFEANTGQDGVKLKGKEIIIDAEYLSEIEEKIKKAETPQELLEYQILKENHEKEKIAAEARIKEAEDIKLEKLEVKAERARINAEAKEHGAKAKEKAKILKEQQKAEKAKAKEEGK